MKQKLFLVLFLALVAPQVVFAQSAKETAKVSNLTILDWTTTSGDWKPILSTSIKTSQQKDLLMSVSLEAGLWSYTLVKGKTGTSDTSSASSGVHVRVLVDGVPVEPGEIVFARRSQALSAVFSGIFQSCTDANANGTITADECQFSNEELSLLLNTMTANSFNFVMTDVGVGSHSVVVQARIENSSAAQAGEAVAKAMIGKGSISVEEVRMVKGTSIFQF